MADVLIRYEYPGTSAKAGEPQRPVGTVYVDRFDALPQSGIYSHTKKVDEATRFSEEEARRTMAGKHWPQATIVPVAEAKDLDAS
jgi:hypothetical protein